MVVTCKNIFINSRHMSLCISSFLQVYVLNPKQDLYGLGFDPYKHAPEFRGMLFLDLYVASTDVVA